MAKLGKMVEDGMTAGFLLGVKGCLPSALGARVPRSGEKVTVTDGPFTESKELVGGFAILKANRRKKPSNWSRIFSKQPVMESANFTKYSRRTRIHKRRGPQDGSGANRWARGRGLHRRIEDGVMSSRDVYRCPSRHRCRLAD
jgi:hypothetical protein